MIRTLIGMILGMAIGAVIGGAPGATLGALCGLAVGLLWWVTGEASPGVKPDDVPVRQAIKVLCVPKGQVAEAVFVRDEKSGKWLDVDSCSLCHPPSPVGCAKRCLVLMRDYRPDPHERRAPAASAV